MASFLSTVRGFLNRTSFPPSTRQKLEEMFGVDLRSLGIFRIGLALVVLGDLIVRATDLEMFYTDAGVLPRSAFLTHLPYPAAISLHLANGSLLFQSFLFLLTGLFALGLLVGYRTRRMTCLCWLMTASLHARNFLVLQGGDDYLRMMLFWSMFLPLGAYYSVDNRLNPASEKLPVRILSWGSVALLIQTMVLYVSTALFKSRGESWWDGTAIYYALSLDCFAREPAFILLLFPNLIQVMTWGVFAFEAFGTFLLISPWYTGLLRTVAVFGFVFLHLGILLSMAIGPFQWISMVAVIPFLPSWFWDRAARRQNYRWPLKFLPNMTQAKVFADAMIARLPQRPVVVRSHWSHGPIILFSLVCVLWWAITALYKQDFILPKAVSNICHTFRLNQGWAMFSPNVTRRSGWFVIPGKLRNGEIVDLYRGGAPLSWAVPPLISAYFKNERQRKYLMNMRGTKQSAYRPYHSRALCQAWNKNHKGEEELVSLEVVMLEREITEYDVIPFYKRTVLWEGYCSPETRHFGPPLPHLTVKTPTGIRPRPVPSYRRLVTPRPPASAPQ